MANSFLLSRALLRFDDSSEARELDDLVTELSAATFSPDGSLWVGADEGRRIERLSRLEPCVFGAHKEFKAADFVPLFNREDEIDIEGLDYASGYLWLTGSHSTKRKKPKGKKPDKDLERLATIETEPNRFLLARIPLHNGELFQSFAHPEQQETALTAARLETAGDSNVLMEALADDPHLGPFIRASIPSKDNGLDIEGLAVFGERIFLGLRGPVLRGWAVILELVIETKAPGVLGLKNLAERPYRKHFLHLQGLGIREMARHGDELLILAGPTMDLEGFLRIYRLKGLLEHETDSLTGPEAEELSALFELPFSIGEDRAEGLAIMPCLGYPEALLVLYDDPSPARRYAPNAVLMDVYRMPE